MMTALGHKAAKACGYAAVNGLRMYYEIEGAGPPLVYIPPAFAFAGLNRFPALIEKRSVITVDLEGHGRTPYVPDRLLSIQQHAGDIVGLLRHLGIAKTDFFGESYGGAIATTIAVRYPELVGRIATYGATFGAPAIAHNPAMLRFEQPPAPDSKGIRFQKENYKRVAPDPDDWPAVWSKISSLQWNGFSKDELAGLRAPVLIAVGDHDFVRVEHAVETFRLIPNAELAVIPDAGHFTLFSEQNRLIPVVEHFLNKPEIRIPIATAEAGYYPGETR